MDMSSISSGLSAITTIKNTINAIRDSGHQLELQTAQLELTNAIIEIQQTLVTLQTINSELSEENTKLKEQLNKQQDWETEKQKYEIVKTPLNGIIYIPKNSDSKNTYYICANCFLQQSISILQYAGYERHAYFYACPKCQNKVFFAGDDDENVLVQAFDISPPDRYD